MNASASEAYVSPSARATDGVSVLAAAAAFSECPTLADLTAETLREISRRHGVDFATALLYDRVTRSSQHAPFIAEIEAALKIQSSSAFSLSPSDGKRGAAVTGIGTTTIAIVPAAFYQEKPHSGADGRIVREAATQLSLRCDLVPLRSTGTLAENSQILLAWLAGHRDESVILVSLCKGGADVKFALNSAGAASRFSSVTAWVNICGTLNGSPIAQWLLATKPRFFVAWLFCKCKRLNFDFLRELVPSPQNPLNAPLQLPPGLRLINIVGFPLRQHLTNAFMRRCHQVISPLGPNDGGLLLADACRMPGAIYPVWGADHYLRPETRARQILTAVLLYLTAVRNPSGLFPASETPAIDRIARTTSV